MIELLYEDDFVFAVNKPNDVLVHHSHYARNEENATLIELLQEQNLIGFPIHRLDRKTSGVILFSKNKSDVSLFQSLFEEKKIQKIYHSLLRGHVIEFGIIDSPVKNERGNYKEACTHFRCLKHFEIDIPVVPYPTSRYSLVEFQPKTGRMHQLRIHANKMSHPIIGDPKYGNRHHNHMFIEKMNVSQLFLHALSLEFHHPILDKKILIQAKKPIFWENWR
jgi:tRNA pseudouridine65 synthase